LGHDNLVFRNIGRSGCVVLAHRLYTGRNEESAGNTRRGSNHSAGDIAFQYLEIIGDVAPTADEDEFRLLHWRASGIVYQTRYIGVIRKASVDEYRARSAWVMDISRIVHQIVCQDWI